jgi:hypothetical protein
LEGTVRTKVIGEEFRTCTSYVERQNLTMRTHMKRLARLTLAFSKKLEKLQGRDRAPLCVLQLRQDALRDPLYSCDGVRRFLSLVEG